MNEQAHNKVDEARILLETLGFDQERSNERSALVLLALAHLAPSSPWATAARPILGIRAIMDWIRDGYKVDYAPNTREKIRRFTLHQFVAGGLVVENPDQPSRPVNSPKWCYQLNEEAIGLIRTNDSAEFEKKLPAYMATTPSLVTQYASERAMVRIPVTLPDGSTVSLSPGGQNDLIKLILDEFCSRYAPGGYVLYIGDAGEKWAVFREAELAALGIHVDKHGKMPDLVVYMLDKNWLLLLEAASSHGPVDAGRHQELATLFAGTTAGLVYVSFSPHAPSCVNISPKSPGKPKFGAPKTQPISSISTANAFSGLMPSRTVGTTQPGRRSEVEVIGFNLGHLIH